MKKKDFIKTMLDRNLMSFDEALRCIKNKTENESEKERTENLIISMEECAELAKEISKSLRGKNDRNDLLQEMADVAISICYLMAVVGIDENLMKRAFCAKMQRNMKRSQRKEKQ